MHSTLCEKSNKYANEKLKELKHVDLIQPLQEFHVWCWIGNIWQTEGWTKEGSLHLVLVNIKSSQFKLLFKDSKYTFQLHHIFFIICKALLWNMQHSFKYAKLDFFSEAELIQYASIQILYVDRCLGTNILLFKANQLQCKTDQMPTMGNKHDTFNLYIPPRNLLFLVILFHVLIFSTCFFYDVHLTHYISIVYSSMLLILYTQLFYQCYKWNQIHMTDSCTNMQIWCNVKKVYSKCTKKLQHFYSK